MKISIDLDNVIFDVQPLYKKAFKIVGKKYKLPNYYDIYKCYPKEIADILMDLFQSDYLYQMPLVYPNIPKAINNLLQRRDMEISFVTERVKKQPEKTFRQLRDAGIHCTLSQVYDMDGFKPDILQTISPDVHYDDSPNVVLGCIERHIPVVMISGAKTPYNHHLCEVVENYKGLLTALQSEGLYNPRQYE
jgi:hypothetical protein